jgi:hypothetical protein
LSGFDILLSDMLAVYSSRLNTSMLEPAAELLCGSRVAWVKDVRMPLRWVRGRCSFMSRGLNGDRTV